MILCQGSRCMSVELPFMSNLHYWCQVIVYEVLMKSYEEAIIWTEEQDQILKSARR